MNAPHNSAQAPAWRKRTAAVFAAVGALIFSSGIVMLSAPAANAVPSGHVGVCHRDEDTRTYTFIRPNANGVTPQGHQNHVVGGNAYIPGLPDHFVDLNDVPAQLTDAELAAWCATLDDQGGDDQGGDDQGGDDQGGDDQGGDDQGGDDQGGDDQGGDDQGGDDQPNPGTPEPPLTLVTPNHPTATAADCSHGGRLIGLSQPAGIVVTRSGSVPGDVTFTFAPVVGYAFPAGTETEVTVTVDEQLSGEDCILGEETTSPKPHTTSPKPHTTTPKPKPRDRAPIVLGTQAAVPTAVDAGLAGLPSASVSPISSPRLAQALVAGGLLLLIAGGSMGLGRRTRGAHES